MRENTDQKISEYGHFSDSVKLHDNPPYWRRSGAFIVNFENILFLYIAFYGKFEQVNVSYAFPKVFFCHDLSKKLIKNINLNILLDLATDQF